MHTTPPILKPRTLRKGDTVGICAPSSPPFEEGHIEFTYQWLAELKLRCKVAPHVFDNYSDFAGRDEDRLADFHAMWADPEVDAILPLRGGNGSVRLLPMLDFELIRRHPKPLIGFSDITGLLIPIHQRTGLVTFHGPTAGNFFQSAYTYVNFQRAVMNHRPLGLIHDPITEHMWNPTYPPPRMVIAQGSARGRLIGGSLTLIRQLMGTPFEIQTDGRILFIEDVGEEPHSIDAMLCQLLLAKKLQGCVGIIFGESVECLPGKSRRNVLPLNFSVERIIKERLGSLGIPVVYGLRLGHGKEKLTLPLGVMATLDVTAGGARFKIEEAGTA